MTRDRQRRSPSVRAKIGSCDKVANTTKRKGTQVVSWRRELLWEIHQKHVRLYAAPERHVEENRQAKELGKSSTASV